MYSFPDSSNNKIAVIGDVMLDHYLFGNCDRISPEAPVQVVDIKNETYTLGGSGNVLKNLIALGCPAYFIAVCGNDDGAQIVQKEVENANPSFYQLINDNHRQTTIKTRVLANKHQLIRLDRENKNDIDVATSNKMISVLKEILPDISVLIFSDYCKGVLSEHLVKETIDLCKLHNVTTIVDTKDKSLQKYNNIDILKPNKKEASIASGIEITDDKTLKEACEIIVEKTNCQTVVVTLSEEGMAIYHNNNLEKIPTKALEVFDVTGAGDTVIASLAFALANKMTISDACEFSNHAAAVVVAKIGSATATLEEINSFR
ncbi:D-glycero-beta-D-manno-heptose-7-phosphate kinase [Mucilaginibacter sp. HC2]|uniref:D-glycero-beta-D-manno-heptose-7-phosphate kinase n=1 Tax=Mucilaginibacter inviolabilis TaxID=2714892 RepID=UPI00140D2090|nr:D-glycero-beta-D-manno-heptose-7-phosphate kinase [Mucilaginibacter inviolabilis]NHA04451.1 D-glycero-beta-D-manno-heptose-7-phosphate kinase [Mucilaginibacter inviolabilis]